MMDNKELIISIMEDLNRVSVTGEMDCLRIYNSIAKLRSLLRAIVEYEKEQERDKEKAQKAEEVNKQ